MNAITFYEQTIMNKQLPLLVFRAVALGLGIGALTLSLMEKISTNDAIVLLSLAVTCLDGRIQQQKRRQEEMKRSALAWQALAKGVGGLAVMALLLFLPAGSWGYWQAWLFLGLLFVPMTCVATWLLVREPELLAKRLSSKEQEKAQRQVVAFSALMFVAGFLLAGFDQRFGWSEMPAWVVAIAAVVMVCGYGLYAEVMRENAYLSRTVEVQENQKVISTGLYGIVRHPMYAATLVLYLAMPIVLGSWVAQIPFLAYPLIIARRIRNEEQVLEEGLAGYCEYEQQVRYRLIPFIW